MNRKTFARIVLFIIYAWFGVLKLASASAASPLVEGLLERTLPWLPFPTFIIILGIFEIIIGVLFLFPRMKKVAVMLFAIHMLVTLMPLLLLPEFAWQSFLVPTLEGQYIIKNLVLIALVLNL